MIRQRFNRREFPSEGDWDFAIQKFAEPAEQSDRFGGIEAEVAKWLVRGDRFLIDIYDLGKLTGQPLDKSTHWGLDRSR